MVAARQGIVLTLCYVEAKREEEKNSFIRSPGLCASPRNIARFAARGQQLIAFGGGESTDGKFFCSFPFACFLSVLRGIDYFMHEVSIGIGIGMYALQTGSVERKRSSAIFIFLSTSLDKTKYPQGTGV